MSYIKEKTRENYYSKISRRAEGTQKNITTALNRFDSYLQSVYHKDLDTVIDEIQKLGSEKQYQAIYENLLKKMVKKLLMPKTI